MLEGCGSTRQPWLRDAGDQGTLVCARVPVKGTASEAVKRSQEEGESEVQSRVIEIRRAREAFFFF